MTLQGQTATFTYVSLANQKKKISLTFAFAKVLNNEPTNKKTLNKIAKPHNLLNRIYQLYSYYQLVKRSIGQSVNQSIST